MPHRLAPLLLVALSLAGCLGYGDDNLVADVIERTYTKRDLNDCTERQTRRFVEQTTFIHGPGAVVMCRTMEQKSRPATSVDVSAVSVRGDSATARVALHGSQIAVRRQTVRLVKSPNGWKLDRITAVDIDRQALDEGYARMLASPSLHIPQAGRRCLLRRAARVPDADVERAIVASRWDASASALAACLSRRATKRG